MSNANAFTNHLLNNHKYVHNFSLPLQGLSERMAKVKRFLWALNFKEIRFSQLSLVEN